MDVWKRKRGKESHLGLGFLSWVRRDSAASVGWHAMVGIGMCGLVKMCVGTYVGVEKYRIWWLKRVSRAKAQGQKIHGTVQDAVNSPGSTRSKNTFEVLENDVELPRGSSAYVEEGSSGACSSGSNTHEFVPNEELTDLLPWKTIPETVSNAGNHSAPRIAAKAANTAIENEGRKWKCMASKPSQRGNGKVLAADELPCTTQKCEPPGKKVETTEAQEPGNGDNVDPRLIIMLEEMGREEDIDCNKENEGITKWYENIYFPEMFRLYQTIKCHQDQRPTVEEMQIAATKMPLNLKTVQEYLRTLEINEVPLHAAFSRQAAKNKVHGNNGLTCFMDIWI
ncbi:hypothetical protein JB92DRAFT_2831431 [Gautieria morchelliformis]|nr:hypothetical protein JB92DRAFT_2831431 [Gautieria morchelliformis]